MPEIFESYRTFLASPGDVVHERAYAEETISALNRSCSPHRLLVDLKKWEAFAPITPNLPDERLQDLINREVGRCHFFILILNKRYGTVDPGETVSRTEREVETILSRKKKHPQVTILSYFRRLERNEDPGPQETKLGELRKRLEEMGVAYREYSTAEEFRNRLTHDLYDLVLRIRLSPGKRQALERFWTFGSPPERNQTRLAIVYPPVSMEPFQDSGSAVPLWQHRLAPHVYYEDFRCLRKIEKTLTLIGFRDYRSYSTVELPPELDYMNRVWICVPRLPMGMARLKQYQANARWSLDPKDGGRARTIVWRAGRSRLRVNSPMSMYFKSQRSAADAGGTWKPSFAKIVLRDYAVLARYGARTDVRAVALDAVHRLVDVAEQMEQPAERVHSCLRRGLRVLESGCVLADL